MTIKEAAAEMASAAMPNMQSVAVSGQTIIAYTLKLTRIPITWRGFKVKQRVMGRVRPALALVFCLFLSACATPTAPSPVTIAPVSLDGIARPIRKAVAGNAAILSHAQRQQVLLAEAEALLKGRTFEK